MSKTAFFAACAALVFTVGCAVPRAIPIHLPKIDISTNGKVRHAQFQLVITCPPDLAYLRIEAHANGRRHMLGERVVSNEALNVPVGFSGFYGLNVVTMQGRALSQDAAIVVYGYDRNGRACGSKVWHVQFSAFDANGTKVWEVRRSELSNGGQAYDLPAAELHERWAHPQSEVREVPADSASVPASAYGVSASSEDDDAAPRDEPAFNRHLREQRQSRAAAPRRAANRSEIKTRTERALSEAARANATANAAPRRTAAPRMARVVADSGNAVRGGTKRSTSSVPRETRAAAPGSAEIVDTRYCRNKIKVQCPSNVAQLEIIVQTQYPVRILNKRPRPGEYALIYADGALEDTPIVVTVNGRDSVGGLVGTSERTFRFRGDDPIGQLLSWRVTRNELQ